MKISNRNKYLFLLIFLIILIALGFLLWPDNNDGKIYSISNNDYITKVSLSKKTDSNYVINAESYKDDEIVLTSTWKLNYPVFHFECGDVNEDGQDDILVGVIKSTRFDSIIRKRIFIFKLYEGYIRPLWLGSRVAQTLEDFRFVIEDSQNLIRTIEIEKNGNFLVAEYKWKSFGLYFKRYLKRDLNLEEARIILRD